MLIILLIIMVIFLIAHVTGLFQETSPSLSFHGELHLKRSQRAMTMYLLHLKLLKRILLLFQKEEQQERQKVDPAYNPDIDPVTGNLSKDHIKADIGETSREVLIPAFLAAYTKSNPNKVGLETFPSALRMMPNWRINFDGLSKFEFVQKVFRSINLMHQYRSTYQIGSYTTNLNYITGW